MKRYSLGAAHWALIDQGFVSIGNFLVGVLMARSLSARDLAVYSLAYTTVLAISTIHRTLISQPMNVLGAQEPRSARWMRYDNMLRMQAIVLPIACIVAAGIGLFYFPIPPLILGVSIYLAAFCLQDFIRRYFYTDGQINLALPGDILSYGGQAVALACLWLLDMATIQLVFAALTVPVVVSAVYTHRQVARLDKESANGETRPEARSQFVEHWQSGKWLVLSQVVWIGASQLIPFQLAAYGNAEDVAAYHVANALMNALNVLRITMGNYLPSQTAARFAIGGRSALSKYLVRVSSFSVVLSGVAFLFFLIAGDFIIDALYGSRFHAAKVIVPTMAAIHLLAMSSLITSAGAQVLGATRVVFSSNLLALVINLCLGSKMISVWGLWGGVALLAVGLLLPALIQAVNLTFTLSAQLHGPNPSH